MTLGRRREVSLPSQLGGKVSGAGRRWPVAFGAAVVLQLLVLYVPRAPSASQVVGLDKAVHVLIFALPVVLGLLAGWRVRLVVATMAAHGPLSEALQTWLLPNRSGSWGDAVADVTGVLLGLGLCRLGGRARRW